MSGDPDLDGVPAPLRRIVEGALTKEADDRPTAAEAARECGALLASQATVVGVAALPPEATAATGPLVTAVWDVPAADDPGWRLPPERTRSRKRLAGAVVLAAALLGGAAGGMVGLMPDDTGGGRPTTTSPTPSAASGRPSPTAAKDSTTVGQRRNENDGPADAKSWAQARTAQGTGEHDVARAVLHDQGVLARDLGDGIDLTPGAVRFHASRREVYFSYRLVADEEGTMYAETEIAGLMCQTLRDVVLRLYPDLTYRTYVMVKQETGAGPQVTWQDDFRTNTQCRSAADNDSSDTDTAPDWAPDEDGLGQAMVPSTDSDEVRVADRAATTIINGTNKIRGPLGTDRALGNDDIAVGFDPGNAAMYVWSDYAGWDGDAVETWAEMAAGEACRALVTQRARAGSGWPYTRYAVAVVGASAYQMVRSGTATTEADCPA
jgi:hypothetical protein